jgi:hypothetical protein
MKDSSGGCVHCSVMIEGEGDNVYGVAVVLTSNHVSLRTGDRGREIALKSTFSTWPPDLSPLDGNNRIIASHGGDGRQ